MAARSMIRIKIWISISRALAVVILLCSFCFFSCDANRQSLPIISKFRLDSVVNYDNDLLVGPYDLASRISYTRAGSSSLSVFNADEKSISLISNGKKTSYAPSLRQFIKNRPGKYNYVSLASDSVMLLKSIDSIFVIQVQSGYIASIPLPGMHTDSAVDYYDYPIRDCAPIYLPESGHVNICVSSYLKSSHAGAYDYPYMLATRSVQQTDHWQTDTCVQRSRFNASGQFGYADNYYRTPTLDGKYTVSFEVDPTVYVVDGCDIETSDAQSAFETDFASHLAPDAASTAKLAALPTYNTYGPVVWHPCLNIGTRLFYAGVPSHTPDGLHATMNDQPAYLQLFDTSYALVQELSLGIRTYANTVICVNDTLRVYRRRDPTADSTFTWTALLPST